MIARALIAIETVSGIRIDKDFHAFRVCRFDFLYLLSRYVVVLTAKMHHHGAVRGFIGEFPNAASVIANGPPSVPALNMRHAMTKFHPSNIRQFRYCRTQLAP